jgi:4-diphosphocytidyl-2-C-methyl-D-erythritol kinase
LTVFDVTEHAPAKINLGLKVIGKRDDGFHDLLSIFQTVSIYDTLHISVSEKSGKPGLTCGHPDVPVDSGNLVLKAEQRIRKNAPEIPPAHYVLDKNVPVGAGLGGGSADAAAALRGLVKLHNLTLSGKTLYEHACELGSDVPFMLHGGTVVVSGRGEHIIDVDWPFEFTYLVVYPGIAVSTAWAYQSLRSVGGEFSAYKSLTDDLCAGKLDEDVFLRHLSNDFEDTVFEKYPLLEKIKSEMISHGAKAACMTGSGSSIVGIFANDETARACADFYTNTIYKIFIAKAVSKMQF